MRPLTLLLRLSALLAVAVGAVTITTTSPAGAYGDTPDGYASFWFAAVSDDQGAGDGDQFGDVSLPDCGPRNINGRSVTVFGSFNTAKWSVGSSVESGTQIEVGDEIVLTATVFGFSSGSAPNDGPDPLNLRLTPTGPVQSAGPIQAKVIKGNQYAGDGFVGPVAQIGAYGYEFDSSSSPKGIAQPGDGAHVKMTMTLEATAPGVITVPKLEVYGHDATPTASDFHCEIPVPFFWSVDDVDPPTSGQDLAWTDARYPFEAFEDANGGTHAINIDVLANDDDPEVGGGPGDTDQVRIQDWQPLSVEGGTVSCGTPEQKGTGSFDAMSTGPCTYTPPVGYAGADKFGYVVESVSGLTRFVWVTMSVVPNRPPVVGSPEFALATDQQIVNGNLAPVVDDPDGDPVTCSLVTGPTGLSVDSDCTFDYDPPADVAEGPNPFTFRACDTHDTLTGAGLGDHAVRAAGYELGDPDDLSATTSRRCRDRVVPVTVYDQNQVILMPPVAGTDITVVDAGYAADGAGAYHLRIPVLANDYDPSDAQFPNEGIGGIEVWEYDGSAGPASFDPGTNELLFSPADGVEGWVDLEYRLCDDPAAQDPPIVDNPDTPFVDESETSGVCGFGTVSIFVVLNDAPDAGPDEVLTSSIDPVTDLDAAVNDTDPQGEAVACTPGALDAAPAGLVESASIDADCLVDLTPVVGAAGVATLAYTVCDAHPLSQPGWADVPYGDDGQAPDGENSRCSEGAITATIVAPAADDPDLFDLDPGPACQADAVTTPAGVPVDVAVLANDSDVDFADQTSPLQVGGAGFEEVKEVSEAGGAAVPTGDLLQVRYTPPAGFAGTDTFVYSAQDTVGHGCAAAVTVTVTGTPSGDGAVAGAGNARSTLPLTGGRLAPLPFGVGLVLLGAGVVVLAGSFGRRRPRS